MNVSDGRSHQGERLFFSMFQRAEAADCIFVSGIYHQMKTTQAFYCHNSSSLEHINRCPDTVTPLRNYSPRRIPQFDMWTAVRTGVWLGMKPPIDRIFIFRAATIAHR